MDQIFDPTEYKDTPLYTVDIDFDDASIEWRMNKIRRNGGSFEYKCKHQSLNEEDYCRNKPVCEGYCSYHYNIYMYRQYRKFM